MIDGQGTLHEAGDRWMLRFERRLAHPPARVWRTITEKDGLATWFPAKVEYRALHLGARLAFTFAEEQLRQAEEAGMENVPMHTSGLISELEPPRIFAFVWDWELCRLELSPDGEGCRLVFTHIFDRDEAQAPRNASGWHVCLDALVASLEGGPAPTAERLPELAAAYASLLR